jgi:hypothetical protein
MNELKERGASGRCQICRAGAQVGVSQGRAGTGGHAMNPGPQPEAMLVAARDVWGPQLPPCLSLTDIGPLPEPGIER